MEFANNWDLSPFPNYMYELVLKLKMRDIGGMGPEAPLDASRFMIKYDPSTITGRYSRPKTAEELERATKFYNMISPEYRSAIPDKPDRPVPYDSPQEKNILGGTADNNAFVASKAAIGSIMRVRAFHWSGEQEWQPNEFLKTCGNEIGHLKASNTPVVSQYPEDFLLYAYRNYIRMPSIARGDGWQSRYKDVRRIEMCLHAVVLTQVFKLRLEDYPEVEPHWHCLASTEVSA
ncbi:MAG: hypothetical protein M3O03_10555 [Pseudomonadota bacterium]|nr:hypothetical protein [Pseudomonadota bacterium]